MHVPSPESVPFAIDIIVNFLIKSIMKKLIGVFVFSFIICSAYSQEASTKSDATSSNIKRDYFFLKDGKMMATKNGDSVVMANNVHLIDGSTLKTDGTVERLDGTTQVLKEGQTIDLDGKIFKPKKK